MCVPAYAQFSITQNNSRFLALEAENTFSITDPNANGRVFTTTSTQAGGTSPSGGSALWYNFSTINTVPTNETVATYRLTFTTAGTYNFFVRRAAIELENDGNIFNNDSFFRPTGFDTAPSTTADNGGASLTYAFSGNLGSYTVTAAQIGQALGFSIGAREGGYLLDRIVFYNTSASSSPSAATLEATANSTVSIVAAPEPSSLAIFLVSGIVGGAGLLRRRAR